MKLMIITLALFLTGTSFAQTLPRKSAFSSVKQTVGLNEVEVKYSRPNVNNRVIFGDLVPYGEVWRLGANACTTIEFDYPIYVNSQKIDTGRYALFALVEKNQWTLYINTNADQWGNNDYDAAKNVVAYTTAVQQTDHTETMTIEFQSVDESSAILVISWDNVSVSMPFTTDTKAVVLKGIEEAIGKGENLAKVYFNAADYFYDEGETEKAEDYLAKSFEVERTYFNVFLKAQMISKENPKEAKKLGKEALELAEKAEKAGWVRYIQENIDSWE